MLKFLRSFTAKISAWHLASLLLITASVQGLVIGGQLLATLFLSPAEMGVLRWLESIIAIAVLATSMGMPSITFREAAALGHGKSIARLLRQTLTPAVLSSALLAMLALPAWMFAAGAGGNLRLLLACAGLAIPANVSRVCIGYVQGRSMAGTYVWAVMGGAMVGVVALTLVTAKFGIDGWVFGRYLAEGILALLLIWMLRANLHSPLPVEMIPRNELWRNGAVANLSFLVRVLCDNLPIILMGWLGVPKAEMGFFGLATLLMLGPSLLLSTIAQNRTPVLVRASDVAADFVAALHDARRSMVGVALWCVVVLALGILAVGAVYSGAYRGAGAVVLLMLCALPARALAVAWGAAFVAKGAYSLSLRVSLVECIALLLLFMVIRPGAGAAAAGLVVTSAWLSVGAAAWVWRQAGYAPDSHGGQAHE